MLKGDKFIKNNNLKTTIYNGLKNGLNTTLLLAKIIVPVYIFITILEKTGILQILSNFLAPVMSIFGLPGEASLVLVFGNMVNIFAAIGALVNLSLTGKEITIIAVMLSFSHSLFTETAVAKKTGVSVSVVLLVRFSLAIISGIILNLVL